jgi:thiol-disulfide isomerase/thioredoxin
MNRTLRSVLAIVTVQATLVGVFWLVEHQRAPKIAESLGTEPPQPVDVPMPALSVVRRDGSRGELPSSGRRTLMHVWATWCPPCRAELPGLLDMQPKHGVDVVAIALDQSWGDVEGFLGDIDLSNVVLAAGGDVERALGIRSLPVTFLVEADGRVSLRFDGTRDWTDQAFVRAYIEEHVDER